MAIVTVECGGDHSVHDEVLRIRQTLAELGLAPVSIGPGTVEYLKLTFAVQFKTDDEAERFRAAIADNPTRGAG